MESTSNVQVFPLEEFIIAPRKLCQSCHEPSGPSFSVSVVRQSAAAVRTTAPATNVERAMAEDNILWARSEGALLDDEILLVQQSLHKLHQKRNALRLFEQQEKSFLISSIHRLPVDVLRHIFLLGHGEEPYFVHDPNIFPRVVTQVCSRWRSVAHYCAPLWANVMCLPSRIISILGILGTIPKYNPKYGKSLEDCVHFSYPIPFTFFLGSPTTTVLLGESCIQALGKCVNRWNEVAIEEWDLVKAIFENIPDDASFNHLELLNLPKLKGSLQIGVAPQLKNLFVTGMYEEGDDNDVYITVDSAPNLAHLRLQNISRPSAVINDVNSSRITQFESYDVRYQLDEFIDVLKRMQVLASLTVYGPLETTKSVTLQSLEALTIGGFDDENALDVFTLPNLKILHVDWDLDSGAITEFIHRCGCPLEELSLSGTSIDESWSNIQLPTLKTLLWDDPGSLRESLPMLTLATTPSANDIFPRLEHLHIAHLFERVDGDMLIRMLESRLQPQDSNSSRMSLKSVHISFKSAIEFDFIPAVYEEFVNSDIVRNSGVEMTIMDPGKLNLTTHIEH